MKKRAVTIILLTLSVLLVGAGAYLGQPLEVMRKAVRVCLECIGIG